MARTTTPRLGLHTPAEQAQAFDLAESAFRAAMTAQENRDDHGYLFARGYLQAVMDVAAVEGADRLAEDILELIQRLEA
jgi:hypothetical protein